MKLYDQGTFKNGKSTECLIHARFWAKTTNRNATSPVPGESAHEQKNIIPSHNAQ